MAATPRAARAGQRLAAADDGVRAREERADGDLQTRVVCNSSLPCPVSIPAPTHKCVTLTDSYAYLDL